VRVRREKKTIHHFFPKVLRLEMEFDCMRLRVHNESFSIETQ
jgi:hypothetical protein